jgi:hypothetical protein
VGSFRFGPGEIDVRVRVVLHIHDVDANKPARQPYRSHRRPRLLLGPFQGVYSGELGAGLDAGASRMVPIGFGLLDVLLSTAGSLTYRPPAGPGPRPIGVAATLCSGGFVHGAGKAER